jgi:hypothetical protein
MEGAMSKEVIRDEKPVSDRLHPLVYIIVAGLALWLLLSFWGFAGGGYTDFLLAVMSAFILVAVGLPFILSRILRRKRGSTSAATDRKSFRDWSAGELNVWQGRRKRLNALIEMLLPIAAVAFGMSFFAIVLHFTAT